MVRLLVAAAAIFLAAGQTKAQLPEAMPLCDLSQLDTPVVASPSTSVHAGHNCPTCGSYQNIVNRTSGSMHSHKCYQCGTEWWHSEGGVATQQMQYSIGGCSGPNCQSYDTGWYPGKLLGRRR